MQIYKSALLLLSSLMPVAAFAASTTRPFDEGIRDAKPGDILLMPDSMDLKQIPIVDIKKVDAHGPQFLLSDKPEYFRTGNGIALQEEVKPGVVRLYIYHCPEPTGAKKTISAVIENLADGPMRLSFLRYASVKPTWDYHKAGKSGLADYFNSDARPDQLPPPRTVPPHSRTVIDPKIDQAQVTKDMLVHGLYEFDIDQPARVTVFQRDPDQDSTKVIDELPKLPPVLPGQHPSGAGRGLFEISNFDVMLADEAKPIDCSKGPVQIILADGKSDPWITGRDSLASDENDRASQDKGNYGVMYKIRLRYVTPDGRPLALMMVNPFPGRRYCDQSAAAVMVNAGPGSAGEVVLLPREQIRFAAFPEAVLIRQFPAVAVGGTGEIDVTYSPPGASCLPLPLVLVRYKP